MVRTTTIVQRPVLSAKRTASRFVLVSLFLVISTAHPTWADVGFRVGPRVGLELHQDKDLFLGADVRLSFPLSPLTINPIFDYYFDEDRTLFQVGVNALYYLPIPTRRLSPYLGAGVAMTGFSFHDNALSPGSPVSISDDNGSRVGLNLMAGVCFDLPVLTPFAQAMITVGDIDLVTIGGGFLFGFGGGRQSWDSCGRRLDSGRGETMSRR
jgi:hypothetical protein